MNVEIRVAEDDKQPPVCPRCGEQVRVAIKVFDPTKQRDVPVYQCQCGELIWDGGLTQ